MSLKDVTNVFPGGTIAIDNLSMDIADGEFIALLGPSGCGKSTLLRIIAGLEEPTAGTVFLDGELAHDLPPKDRNVAMVFQDYALYPHKTVAENIDFPLKVAGLEPAECEARINGAAATLGITHLLDRRPAKLSGGQRQRVAMGRAIVREPRYLLLDEPLSNLNAGLRSELRAEISGLSRQLGATTLYVTHDQTEALTMADRIAILRQGRLLDIGTPTEVYSRPATTTVATFLGSPKMSLLEATIETHHDSHLTIYLGRQALHLPWTHSHARMISRYHGEMIVVGVRPEALTPVAASSDGATLAGEVRCLEHHGHETLAFLDIGATRFDRPDPPITAATRTGRAGRPRTIDRLAARFTSRADDPAVDDGAPSSGTTSPTGRHHRRSAELIIRLAPYPRLHKGESLSIAVDLEAMHFFDQRGHRIGDHWR